MGPLCRHAEDLQLVLGVLAGERGAGLLQLHRPVTLSRCRYFRLTTTVGGATVTPVQPEVTRRF